MAADAVDSSAALLSKLSRQIEASLQAHESERAASQERRAQLSKQTREYRTLDASQKKGNELSLLMKSFQTEVDLLTKRAEKSEGAFLELSTSVRGLQELLGAEARAQSEWQAEDLSKLQATEQSLRQQLETTRSEGERAVRDKVEALDRVSQKLEETETELSKQRALAGQLSSRLSQQTEELKSLEDELVALQGSEQSRTELQRQLSQRDGALSELKKAQQTALEEKESLLRAKEEEWTSRQQKTKKKLAEAQESLAKAVRKSKDREEHWKRVYEEEQKTSRKVIPERDQAKVALRRAEEEKERLGQRIAQLEGQIESMKASEVNKAESSSALEQQLKEARGEALILQKHLETSSIARDQTRRELEQATGIHSGQVEQLREQREALERERDVMRTQFVCEFQKAEEREQTWRRQAEEASKQVAEVQAALAGKSKEIIDTLAKQQLEVGQLKKGFAEERTKLMQMIDDSQATLTKERGSLSTLSHTVHTLQQERLRLLDDTREAVEQSRVMQETVARLETQLQQLLVSRKTAVSQQANLESDLAEAGKSAFAEETSPAVVVADARAAAPRPMHMDDEFLRPAGCLAPWQSRSTATRSVPSLPRKANGALPSTASSVDTRGGWGSWIGGFLGKG